MRTNNQSASQFWPVLKQAQQTPDKPVWDKVERMMRDAGFDPLAGHKLAVPGFFFFSISPKWVIRTQSVPWPTMIDASQSNWLTPITDAIEIKSQAFLKTIFKDTGINWRRVETSMKNIGFAPEKGGRIILPLGQVTVVDDIPYWATLSRRYPAPVVARETRYL